MGEEREETVAVEIDSDLVGVGSDEAGAGQAKTSQVVTPLENRS